MKRALPLFMLFLLAPEAFANEFAARDTAQVPRVGGWSAGVLHPLRWVPLPNVEFRLHPLVFALAPHASARVSHVRSGAWTLSGDYGLAVPYLAAKALQGHLFPAYERGGGDVGFSLLPSLGALLSHHSAERVITAKLDVAFRLPIVASDLRPLEAPAPIEMLFAPWLNDYRLRAGGLWDSRVSPRLRARCYVDVFVHGVDADRDALVLDHFTFRTGAGLDVAVSSRWRLAVGVVVWNAQQFAKDDHGRPKRSTDVLPVLDAIWALPGQANTKAPLLHKVCRHATHWQTHIGHTKRRSGVGTSRRMGVGNDSGRGAGGDKEPKLNEAAGGAGVVG